MRLCAAVPNTATVARVWQPRSPSPSGDRGGRHDLSDRLKRQSHWIRAIPARHVATAVPGRFESALPRHCCRHRGLDRRVHPLRRGFAKVMDARVKPRA